MRRFNMFGLSCLIALLLACQPVSESPSSSEEQPTVSPYPEHNPDNTTTTDDNQNTGSAPAEPIPAGSSSPLLDNDRDLVDDRVDECADTPYGDRVDQKGCSISSSIRPSSSGQGGNSFAGNPKFNGTPDRVARPPNPNRPNQVDEPNTENSPDTTKECITNITSNECLADLPNFPWPLPEPSSYDIFREDELRQLKRDSFGELTDSLEQILKQSGYSKFKYYNIPTGVAMATQLERINNEGKPFPIPERWDIENLGMSLDNFDLVRLLRILVGAEPGYYRVLVFVLTDINQVIVFDDAPNSEQEIVNMATDGAIMLPENIREIEFNERFKLTVLVYEMERKRASQEATMHQSGIKAKDHLEYTNINL